MAQLVRKDRQLFDNPSIMTSVCHGLMDHYRRSFTLQRDEKALVLRNEHFLHVSYRSVDDTSSDDQLQCEHHEKHIEHGVDRGNPNRNFVRPADIGMD